MTIPETIKKAIEGGWKNKIKQATPILSRRFGLKTAQEMYFMWVFSDPSFWQCLGKAMGWEIMYRPYKSGSTRNFDAIQGWLYQWHRFIDHLAEGGTAEEFFKEIGSNYKELK